MINSDDPKELEKRLKDSQTYFKNILLVVTQLANKLQTCASAVDNMNTNLSGAINLSTTQLESASKALELKKAEISNLLTTAISNNDTQAIAQYTQQMAGVVNGLNRVSGQIASASSNNVNTITTQQSSTPTEVVINNIQAIGGGLLPAVGGGGGMLPPNNSGTGSLPISAEPGNSGDSGGPPSVIDGGGLPSVFGGGNGNLTLEQNPALTAIKVALDTIIGINEKIREATTGQLDKAMQYLDSQDVAGFDARLYGLIESNGEVNANFIDMASDVIDLVSNSIGPTMYVNEQTMIANMAKLVNDGVAYNVEQRAMWMTLEEKIVSTFDANNQVLTALIRLQQTDTTEAYMGVEAAITRTLNSMFKDTSYLSNTYDAVWGNLSDALANVDSTLGTEIAYQVQLWLGSLSSLGLSSNAASGISSAINALLTGNVSSLGNQGETLLAMAAANQNMSFADLLLNGVESGSEMSQLMQGIITVLQNIYSESADNNVLLSQWGNILNLSISDWKAISNLQQGQIDALSNQSNFSSLDAINEIEYISDNLIAQRTLISERINNLVNNELFAAGWDLATDAEDYLKWKESSVISQALSSFNLSGIADLVFSYTQLDYLTSAWIEPLKNLVSTITDEGLLSQTSQFSKFYNSSNNGSGTSGSYVGELFDTLLNTNQDIVAYDAIKHQSFYRTTSGQVETDVTEGHGASGGTSVPYFLARALGLITGNSLSSASSTSSTSDTTGTTAAAGTTSSTSTNSISESASASQTAEEAETVGTVSNSEDSTASSTEDLTQYEAMYQYFLTQGGFPVNVLQGNVGVSALAGISSLVTAAKAAFSGGSASSTDTTASTTTANTAASSTSISEDITSGIADSQT